MAHVAPALRLCKHQITILASLTPLTISSSINIFFAFRILQTRMMILYFIALTQTTSWAHYFEELHVYVTFMALRSLHTNNSPDPSLNLAQFISDFVTFLVSSHCSTLDPRLTIPWKENIPDFANSNKYMKGNSSFQNWQFVTGLIATIFSYGAQYLSMFEENDIGPWNMHLSNFGNQN